MISSIYYWIISLVAGLGLLSFGGWITLAISSEHPPKKFKVFLGVFGISTVIFIYSCPEKYLIKKPVSTEAHSCDKQGQPMKTYSDKLKAARNGSNEV